MARHIVVDSLGSDVLGLDSVPALDVAVLITLEAGDRGLVRILIWLSSSDLGFVGTAVAVMVTVAVAVVRAIIGVVVVRRSLPEVVRDSAAVVALMR